MSIDKIQDYINRLNISDSQLHKLKQYQDVERSSEFQNLLKKEVYQNLQGKVSSSEITVPHNIKEEIQKDPYRKKLFNASVEFESIFVKLMLNQMKKNIEKQPFLHGGYAEEVFEDMLYDEYSKEISKNAKLGLAEQLYLSLSKKLPPIENKERKDN